MNKKHLNFVGILLILLSVTSVAKAEVSAETAYMFNTFSFLIHGILVMLMAAGFAMLESGMVRTKNTAAICLKNIALYSIAGLMFYLVGYQIMYGGETPYFGIPAIWGPSELASDEVTFFGGEENCGSYKVFRGFNLLQGSAACGPLTQFKICSWWKIFS